MRRTKSESEETRQRVLDAAETVFLEMGVSRASLERIAQEAGVTRGAIYWHFSNKQQIFNAIVDRVYSLHTALSEKGMEGAPDPLKAVAARALDIIDLFQKDTHARTVYQIIVTRCEYVGEMQEALLWQRSLRNTMLLTFERAFETAQANGDLARPWNAETASTTLQCFMSGMLNDWLRYDFSAEFAETVRNSLQKLMTCFRADQQPERALASPQATHGSRGEPSD